PRHCRTSYFFPVVQAVLIDRDVARPARDVRRHAVSVTLHAAGLPLKGRSLRPRGRRNVGFPSVLVPASFFVFFKYPQERRSVTCIRRRLLMLEELEARNLLSTSIPLDPVNWTALGPAPMSNGQTPGWQPVSGRIAALAADPNDANVLYLAAAGGGVWKTTDAGADWTPLTDDQPTLFMGALALAPSDPNIIYAGTGEATNSILSFTGHGVLKSTDGGTTWTLLGQNVFDRHTISQIVVSPAD